MRRSGGGHSELRDELADDESGRDGPDPYQRGGPPPEPHSPVLGAIPLANIRPEDIRFLIAMMVAESGSRPRRSKRSDPTTSQVLETAEIDGLIGRSPCRGVKLPDEPEGEEMLFLTPEQVVLLADTIEPRFQALVLCAAYSGMRAGELSALRLQRVDFLRGRIKVLGLSGNYDLQLRSSRSARRHRISMGRERGIGAQPSADRLPVCRLSQRLGRSVGLDDRLRR